MDDNQENLPIGDNLRGQLKQKADGALEAPKEIVPTPAAARAIYNKYRLEHVKRIQLYAQIEGLIAGNPPYNPVDLAEHGLNHIANFNNLDGRSLYERGALAYWNLLNEAETLIKFELIGIDDRRAVEWANTMARHWDDVVRTWPSFITQVNTLSAQLIKFGISPVIWTNEDDWRWKTIELQRFFVADQTLCDVEEINSVCVESFFSVQYLYEVYKTFSDKPVDQQGGWNMEELKALLLNRANLYTKQDNYIVDMFELQRRLQNGDLNFADYFSDNLKLVSLLYKEYDGKISHYMFDRVFDQGKFLFKVVGQYDTLQQGLVIFTASPGEFTIHSNRGLGHKILSGCQAMMQLDCSIVDMARWSSTPLIKSLATGSKDFETIRFYPGVPTNIGTAEFVENQMGANIGQLVSASQYVNGKLQYNTANSGDDPGVPDRNTGSKSAPEFMAKSFKEFGVLKHNVAFFYYHFDIVIKNMVAKMLHSKKGYPGYSYCKEWKERCIKDGVPEQLFATKDSSKFELPKHLKAMATRVAGDGSTLAKIMGLQSLGGMVSSFGPKGVKAFQKQVVSSLLGRDYVNEFISPEEPDEVAGGASLAGVENAIMQAGKSPIYSADNEHRAHIAVHMALGNEIISAIQQQQTNAVEADKIFSVLIPHMNDHVQFVQQSPFEQQFFAEIRKPWDQLQEYAKLNRKNAAAMIQKQIREKQELEAKNQRVLSEEELKNLQVQGDERRNQQKLEASIQNQERANENKAELGRRKVEADASNTRLKIQLEAQNKGREIADKQVEETPLATLRTDLSRINGSTIAPNDIET